VAAFTLEIEGIAPLLMHSARLADPLDDATKALAKVTSKRKKTDDDHAEVGRLEHLGSLYIADQLGPYIPGANVEACLFKGATRTKQGTFLKSALLIPEEVNPLIYAGPRDAAGLWQNKSFVHRSSVKVGTSRVIRTRPVFANWQLVVEGELDLEVVDQGSFATIAENAGRLVGLGDWRPRFGRFKVNALNWAA
jgi:hypothetical protein